jgi:hypothetical protein
MQCFKEKEIAENISFINPIAIYGLCRIYIDCTLAVYLLYTGCTILVQILYSNSTDNDQLI